MPNKKTESEYLGFELVEAADCENIFQKEVSDKAFKLDDFNVIKMLGKGSFGKVYLVERKDNKQLYAMKTMRKDFIIRQQQIESTILEKNIMKKISHPFIVPLDYAFQSKEKVYLIMKFYQRRTVLSSHGRKKILRGKGEILCCTNMPCAWVSASKRYHLQGFEARKYTIGFGWIHSSRGFWPGKIVRS